MAEIRAIVKSTAELLSALDHAKVFSFRIRTVPDGTANFFATMSLTLFDHVADSLALQVVDLVNFFCCHVLFTELIRIVYLVARELCLLLIAYAAFVDHLFTAHTLTIVTLHLALMPSTR